MSWFNRARIKTLQKDIEVELEYSEGRGIWVWFSKSFRIIGAIYLDVEKMSDGGNIKAAYLDGFVKKFAWSYYAPIPELWRLFE